MENDNKYSKRAKNIITYTGEAHTRFEFAFLKYVGFEEINIQETSNNPSDEDFQMLNIENFDYPFFGIEQTNFFS